MFEHVCVILQQLRLQLPSLESSNAMNCCFASPSLAELLSKLKAGASAQVKAHSNKNSKKVNKLAFEFQISEYRKFLKRFCLILIYFHRFAGLKFCANRRTSHVLHLMWGALYAVCGVVQFVAGIYFMLELPIFQLGSNIWTGAWVSHCLF